MYIDLLDITNHPEQLISEAASISHGKDTATDPQGLCKKLVKRGHWTPFEFAHAIFRINDISRICSHQMCRHRHLSIVERSLRYCEMEHLIKPHSWTYEDSMVYNDIVQICTKSYDKFLKSGKKKEDARFILPLGTSTKMVVSANFRAWKEFIEKRNIESAQWEIREVANSIKTRLLKCTGMNYFWEEN